MREDEISERMSIQRRAKNFKVRRWKDEKEPAKGTDTKGTRVKTWQREGVLETK